MPTPAADLAAAFTAVVDPSVSVVDHPTPNVVPPAVIIRPANPHQAPAVAAGVGAAAWAFEVDIIVAIRGAAALRLLELGRQQLTAALPPGWRWTEFGQIGDIEIADKVYLRGVIGVATIQTDAR
jgi:hypothetical protein